MLSWGRNKGLKLKMKLKVTFPNKTSVFYKEMVVSFGGPDLQKSFICVFQVIGK